MEDLHKKTYETIDFINRFENLGKVFSADFKEAFKDFNNEEIIKIVAEFNYNAKFIKGDNFFKILEKYNIGTFQFNIILKDGIAEFVFNFKKEGVPVLDYCGSWAAICYKLGYDLPIKKPVFRNYQDLREILEGAFCIYGDFKKALTDQGKLS